MQSSRSLEFDRESGLLLKVRTVTKSGIPDRRLTVYINTHMRMCVDL